MCAAVGAEVDDTEPGARIIYRMQRQGVGSQARPLEFMRVRICSFWGLEERALGNESSYMGTRRASACTACGVACIFPKVEPWKH